MTLVGLLGCGMVGGAWLRDIPWVDLDMTPRIYDPAGADVSPFELVAAPTDLADSEILLVFVGGTIAEKAVQSVFREDGGGPAAVLDFSSNGPEGKWVLAEWCSARGCRYVDVTILGAVAAIGIRTPLAVAGDLPAEARRLLVSSGAELLVLESGSPGDAARLKLLRSFVTKGLEALACEAQAVVDDLGLRSDYRKVYRDVDAGGFTTLVESMVATHPDHRQRRGAEMRAAITMVEGTGRSSALLEAVALNFEEGAFRRA